MSDCSKHKKEVAGISDMKVLAEMIGDLHYETLTELMYQLSKKIDEDATRDYKADRVGLASALQYAGYSVFESSCRFDKVWKISKPFMETNNQLKDKGA